MYALTGGIPSLLKAVCHQLASLEPLAADQWRTELLAQQSVKSRLQEIWEGLSQAEQAALAAIGELRPGKKLRSHHEPAINTLEEKGLVNWVDNDPRIVGELLEKYVDLVVAGGEGAIWQDGHTGEFYRGDKPLRDLTPLQTKILLYFLENERVRLTNSQIVFNCWPPDKREEATDWALTQQIRGLRQRIELNPSRPSYIITWRGDPEGGYQFFPEGKPAG